MSEDMTFCRGGGIRTHDFAVPIGARYQAALHPAKISIDTVMVAHVGINANAAITYEILHSAMERVRILDRAVSAVSSASGKVCKYRSVVTILA
jgi:hypothetical protein